VQGTDNQPAFRHGPPRRRNCRRGLGSELFLSKNNPHRNSFNPAVWPKCLVLGACRRSRAEVNVISVQRCSITWAIFPCVTVALSLSYCFLPLKIVDNVIPNIQNTGFFPVCCSFWDSITNRCIWILKIFGNIHETQSAGIKIEVHVHLTNAFHQKPAITWDTRILQSQVLSLSNISSLCDSDLCANKTQLGTFIGLLCQSANFDTDLAPITLLIR